MPPSAATRPARRSHWWHRAQCRSKTSLTRSCKGSADGVAGAGGVFAVAGVAEGPCVPSGGCEPAGGGAGAVLEGTAGAIAADGASGVAAGGAATPRGRGARCGKGGVIGSAAETFASAACAEDRLDERTAVLAFADLDADLATDLAAGRAAALSCSMTSARAATAHEMVAITSALQTRTARREYWRLQPPFNSLLLIDAFAGTAISSNPL